MSKLVTVAVSFCMECPFCYDGREVEDEVRCLAVDLGDQFRAIGRTQTKPGTWAPIPRWCPLRKADRPMTSPLHLGLTATRHGMSDRQWSTVHRLVTRASAPHGLVAHHGECDGGDAQFHRMLVEIRRAPDPWRAGPIRIVVHPGPVGGRHRGDCEIDPKLGDELLDHLPYMKRNAAIVAASQVMVAAPFEDEPQPRGGTWATIGMARRALRRGLLRGLHVVGRDGQLLDHARWP